MDIVTTRRGACDPQLVAALREGAQLVSSVRDGEGMLRAEVAPLAALRDTDGPATVLTAQDATELGRRIPGCVLATTDADAVAALPAAAAVGAAWVVRVDVPDDAAALARWAAALLLDDTPTLAHQVITGS